jgi:hypothetical protein
MTTAQKSLRNKMLYIMERVQKPLSCLEEAALIESLEAVRGTGVWHHAIQKAVSIGCATELIPLLASQAVDDPLTMHCVMGLDGLILLLRTTVPKRSRWQRFCYRLRLSLINSL